MTYGALAMSVGAILFRGHAQNGRGGHGEEDARIAERRADRGRRRPVPGDPAMIEDDYFRFLNAPRD
jgi:hypothetical protein